jgi:signal transduction histidine kinase
LKILVVSDDSTENSLLPNLQSANIGEINIVSGESFKLNSVDYHSVAALVLESNSISIQELAVFPSTPNIPVPIVYVLSKDSQLTSSDFEQLASNTYLKNIEVLSIEATIGEIHYKITKTIRQFQALQFRNEVIALKDQVLAIIAHDLKNVFVGLQGLSKNLTLMTEGLDEDTVEYFSLIESGIDQGYLLLINLLEWSKLQSGQSLLRFQQMPLSEIIEQNVTLLYPMSFKKSQEVLCTIDDDIEIFCDKNMISSVIRNIMNNAMKFTPEFGKITINAEKNIAENLVTISISDTGIGIAEDQIKKIFFTDSTETTAGTSGELGTGLGLLLCKDLIQRNGGTFWVKSSLGKGTSFFFTVPIRQYS